MGKVANLSEYTLAVQTFRLFTNFIVRWFGKRKVGRKVRTFGPFVMPFFSKGETKESLMMPLFLYFPKGDYLNVRPVYPVL